MCIRDSAYPAPNSVPYRVVPVMCGTPDFLSRTMVTSLRPAGFSVEATWSEGTPNDASLKKLLIFASVRPE